MGNSLSAVNGERIGSYAVEKVLGKGSFAEVKLGRHVKTGERVALKLIEKSSIVQGRRKVHLQREIKFLKLLCHPHISLLYEVIETDRHVVLIMEHASGGELLNYIRRSDSHRLKERESKRIFRQIVSAVDYCHQNSLLHRDLKPENILLDKNMDVKIIDFGFSNTFQEGVLLDSFIGSPHYAAPELLQGIKYSGPEVDMWSLGVLLYVMICGYLPFKDKDMKVLYEKIKNGNVVFPDHISESAKNLIRQLLAVNPKNRATMRDVYHHKWIREGYTIELTNYLHPRPEITQIDPRLFHHLLKYGYEKEEALRVLQKDGKSPIKNIYYLLWEKDLREQTIEGERHQKKSSGRFKKMGSWSSFFYSTHSSSKRKKEKVALTNNMMTQFLLSQDDHPPTPTRSGIEILCPPESTLRSSAPTIITVQHNSTIKSTEESSPPLEKINEYPETTTIPASASDMLNIGKLLEPSKIFVKNLDTGEICALSHVEESVRRQIQHKDSIQYHHKYFKHYFEDYHQPLPTIYDERNDDKS
jgi:serine/threonine protein kinase